MQYHSTHKTFISHYCVWNRNNRWQLLHKRWLSVYQPSIKGLVLFHRLIICHVFLLYGYLNGLYFVKVNSSLIQSKLRSHYVYYGSTTCKVPTSLVFSCVAADDRVNIYLCQMFIWKWLLWLYWHLHHKLKSLHHTQCHHTCIMWLETYA